MTTTRQRLVANRRRSLLTALYLSTGRLIVAYTAHLHAYFLIADPGAEVQPAFKSFEPDSCLGTWSGECERDLSALFGGEYYGGRLSCTATEFDRTLRHGGPQLPRKALRFWTLIHDLCQEILIGGSGRTVKDLDAFKEANFTDAVETYYDIKHGIFDRHDFIKQPERNLNL